MHFFLNIMSFGKSFQFLLHFTCSGNKKLAVFGHSESFQQNIDSLIVNQPAREKHLDIFLITEPVCKNRTSFDRKIIPGVMPYGTILHFISEIGKIVRAVYMTFCSGYNAVRTFKNASS